jgi:hypothetical protein
MALVFGIAFTISSCTKEQQLLAMLHGNWTAGTPSNCDGTTPTPDPTVVTTTVYSFFDCNLKNQNRCTYSWQSTTVTTTGSNVNTQYSSGTGTYSVEEKSILIIDNNVFDIDNVSKKSMTIHSADCPKGTWTFTKN